MMVMAHWTIAFASALLMLNIGEVHGTNLRNGVSYESGVDSNEDGINEVLEERRRLCYDDPYLKYLHFNANLGSTSFEDCSWVGEDTSDRCILPATNGRIENTVLDGTTSLQLKHLCPKTCGECQPPLEAAAAEDETEPETETELDRENYNPPTDDLTSQQIKELEIKLRRQKMNQKKKRKGRKPCPCPDGSPHDGNGGGGGDGEGGDGTPVMAPTMAPQTMIPTTDSTSTGSYTSSYSSTWTGSWSSTWTGTSTSTFFYTSEVTTPGTSFASFSGTEFSPEINAVISGQESSIKKRKANKRLAITLSVIPLLLLLLVFYCLLRRMRASREGKAESDTESEEGDFPIHKTKSVDSTGSRFLRVLGYFNGRQDDSRCDVHHCTSATCEICANDTPRQVRSVDSYRDEYDRTKEEKRKERYMVSEVEC